MKNIHSKILLAWITLGMISITTFLNAQSFKLPKYQKSKLKNGMTIYLMEQKEVPLISVSMVFDAGAVKDNKAGLANFTADALMYGTKNYTKSQIEEQVDFLGADISTYAEKEYAQLEAKFASKDQDKMFEIIKELITNPVFDKVEFEKSKKRKLLNLEQEKESPRSVMDSYYNKLIFGNHEYAKPIGGTPSGVSSITNDDVKKFYSKNYLANKTAIAIVGDFSSKEMKAKITKLFGSWKTTKGYSKKAVTPKLNFSKNQVLLINKDNSRETTFYIGGKGVSMKNPDYVAVQVMNTILGGRFTSWLNDELRVNSGLTYGARSIFDRNKNAGTFYIYSFTKTSTTVDAIDLALKVLDSLHTKGVDEKTLLSAKKYIKGRFPTRYETAGQIASLLTNMYVFGFNESYINNFEKNVDELNVAKSKEIVDKYFPKNNLRFLLVGKASEIKDEITKYGEVTQKEIKDDGF